MNAVLDCPKPAPAWTPHQTTPPETTDPFAGKPLLRELHIAGIKILNHAQVKRDQNTYKTSFCAKEADTLWRIGTPAPFLGDHPTTHLNFLMATTQWEKMPVSDYRNETMLDLANAIGYETPPIPPETDAIAREVKMRVPEATVEVETFYKDPYLLVTLGDESYYIGHWE